MQKIKLLVLFVALIIVQGCKKDTLLEDNLQSVFDFHLAEVIHHSVEIGLLPQYDSTFVTTDMSLFTNLKLDSMAVTANEASLSEPHTFYYSYNSAIENPTKRNITGDFELVYFGAAVDSLSIVATNLVVGGLKTTYTGAYSDLSKEVIYGETQVEVALATRDSIFLYTTRTIKPITIGNNDYARQEITIVSNGTDRLGQNFKARSKGNLTRMYQCKMYYNEELSVKVDEVPDKIVTYPSSCNGAAVIESQGQLTNIVFY